MEYPPELRASPAHAHFTFFDYKRRSTFLQPEPLFILIIITDLDLSRNKTTTCNSAERLALPAFYELFDATQSQPSPPAT